MRSRCDEIETWRKDFLDAGVMGLKRRGGDTGTGAIVSMRGRWAFPASAIASVSSVPVAPVLAWPDLPGFVAVGTGFAALVWISRSKPLPRLGLLKTLLVSVLVLLALHRVLHIVGADHRWLGPIYVAAFGLYCITALGTLMHRPQKPDRAVPNGTVNDDSAPPRE